MKHIQLLLSFLIFSLYSTSVLAQKLRIESFAEQNGNLSARTNQRLDANKKPCALVKVFVNDEILSVEGSVIGSIVKRQGLEKWIYLEEGTKEFIINTQAHFPLKVRFDQYDMTHAIGSSTYHLNLAEESAGGSAVVDAGKQYLVMNVQPKNATVFIDGKLEKVDADGVVMTYLPYGNYSYRVMAVGYKEQSGTVTIGREKATLDVTLSSTMATLDVSCATSGADIYINGNREGTGSWRGLLAAGTYNLEAKRTGYRSNSTSVTLAENESRSVTIPALSPIYGAINVGYTPANSEVWLDGKKLGTTPDIFRNVGVGSHSLQIKKDGYEAKTLNVTVAEGQTADVQGSLSRVSSSSSSTSSSLSSSGNAIRKFTVNGVSFNMIKVAGGTFTMGANVGDSEAESDEKPRHEVTLSDYYIGETEVTQALWKAVMGSNPSVVKGDNLPVGNVSWNDCQEFVRKLNVKAGATFSLPTEAEWEYAARGGSESRGYKYSGSNSIDAVAWYDGNSGNKAHSVKTKQANELGIYDMSGNVYEWCSDWKGSYGSSSQTNPTGASSGSSRVIRGGSWDKQREELPSV